MVFSSFQTGRGGHCFDTPKAIGEVEKSNPAQVGRALAQPGISHTPSHSPEFRGLMQRVFGTLQGGLPQALRLAGIDTIQAANAWLRASYMGEFNGQFGVAEA